MPRVTIIVLNWNGWRDTIECIESLIQVHCTDCYDIIIVDNGSEDNSTSMIIEYCKGHIPVESTLVKYDPKTKPIEVLLVQHNKDNKEPFLENQLSDENNPNPRIIIIQNEKNHGFAEGNNIAIRFALKYLKSDYILLLNNDTVVEKEFLIEQIKIAESDRTIGICGSINLYYAKPNMIWYSGGNIKWISLSKIDNTRNKMYSSVYKKIKEVDDVVGSSLLIKQEVIAKIGLLNPKYFCYFEETEWCTRAKKAGYKVISNGRSIIWHKVSSSSKKLNGFQQYLLNRNRIIFMYRNSNKIRFSLFSLHTIFLVVPLNIVVYIIQYRQLTYPFVLLKANYDGFKFVLQDYFLRKKWSTHFPTVKVFQ